ncbi:hypothetical protein CROQUDRAFT_43948 [Cronartium quercuum f. sp. fusiforme G11]|uniref:MFS general substrate transporter n=1 Tax=Cronartium quercuum f. sp. fusiforme G11 TaxID=708437 RepID=A0A9P6TDH2_9BASI|nr:hypothetical protein CROQUDRAFT_43948 [Cronartium quercuum f. sp. fusiforme G11]
MSVSGPSPQSSPKRYGPTTPLLTPHASRWRKPHAFWLIPVLFLMAISLGMNTGPKLEIQTQLICHSLAGSSPEFEHEIHPGGFLTVNNSDWVNRCRRDPRVSSRLAILSTTISLVLGILSALTTAFWCARSERHGRRPVFGWAFGGFVANDLAFLFIIHLMRAGLVTDYRLLVIPAIIEGLTGGPATVQALFNSYIHDCSSPGRSQTTSFSQFLGVMMAGVALGPTISAKLVPLRDDILLPFYVILVLLTLVLIFSLLVIPESLSNCRRAEFVARYEQERNALADTYTPTNGSRLHLIRLRIFQHRKMYLNFLKPLAILLPVRKIETGQWDWNLFLIAIAYGTYGSSVGAYGVRLQYAVFRFEWGPVETGYFLTTLGLCRVLALLLILPLLIRLWKRPDLACGLGSPSTSSAGSAAGSLSRKLTCRLKEPQPRSEPITVSIPALHASPDQHKIYQDAKFDLKFARYSIIWDALQVTLLIVSPSPTWFVAGSGLQSLSGSTSPAISALALGIVPGQLGGRVIASLSVVQTLTSNVFGPFVFGGVYSASVGRFSEAFLVVDLVLFVMALVVLSMVKIRSVDTDGNRAVADDDSSSSSSSEEEETEEVSVQTGI